MGYQQNVFVSLGALKILFKMVEHAEMHQSICCKQCHQVRDSNNKFQKIIFLQTKLAAAHSRR
jgi:hypothetical protein